jgi:hypothetical protein
MCCDNRINAFLAILILFWPTLATSQEKAYGLAVNIKSLGDVYRMGEHHRMIAVEMTNLLNLEDVLIDKIEAHLVRYQEINIDNVLSFPGKDVINKKNLAMKVISLNETIKNYQIYDSGKYSSGLIIESRKTVKQEIRITPQASGLYDLQIIIEWHAKKPLSTQQVSKSTIFRLSTARVKDWVIESYRSEEIVAYFKYDDHMEFFLESFGLLRFASHDYFYYLDGGDRRYSSITGRELIMHNGVMMPVDLVDMPLGKPPFIYLFLGNGCGMDKKKIENILFRLYSPNERIKGYVVECHLPRYNELEEFILYKDNQGYLRLNVSDKDAMHGGFATDREAKKYLKALGIARDNK